MPDILLNVLNGASKRLKDMGDGTVAEVVFNANSGGGAGGSVTVSNLPATQAVTDSNLGATTDAGATSDGGAFSLIALTKRLLTKLPMPGAQPMANALPVSIASDQIVPVSLSSPSSSATLAALNASAALTLNGANGATIDVRGVFVATLSFQGTVDGVNWFSIVAMPVASGSNAALVSTANGAGAWHVLSIGLQQIRVSATAYTSGSATVTVRATQATPFLYNAPAGVTNTVTVASGTISNLAAIAAGTNAIGDVGVQYRNSVAGAASVVAVMSGPTPQAVTAKASAGRLIGLALQNSATTLRSLKLFNTASVTLGTTPALFEIDLPPGGALNLGFEGGIGFSGALAYAITSSKGLTDATATGLAANDVSGALIFA